jgi:hypothetical protein
VGLALGIACGLAAGLYYAWILNPVTYVEANPARLSSAQQTEYVYLVGRSYHADPDLALAQNRLAELEQPDVEQLVSDILEVGIREGRPPEDIRALAALARALGVQSSAVAFFAPPPQPAATSPIDPEQAPPLFAADIPVASSTAGSFRPTPTPTPAATLTATPVTIPTDIAPRFQLLNREQLCPPENEGGRIEVLVVDANGTPQPGTVITVSWPTGSDRFVTGFKEGGYGDFVMQPDTVYTITLPDGRTGEENLSLRSTSTSTACPDNQPTTWRLTYELTINN